MNKLNFVERWNCLTWYLKLQKLLYLKVSNKAGNTIFEMSAKLINLFSIPRVLATHKTSLKAKKTFHREG